jgi:hypothetical protein
VRDLGHPTSGSPCASANGRLADKLQENDLAAVRALSKRYAEVDRHMPFVASITITPIAKADAGKG